MFKLARYLKAYRFELIAGPATKLVEAIFELYVPVVMAKIIDIGINGSGGKPYILKMGGIMILLGFLGLCFTLCCQYLASKASQGVGTNIRNDLFKHINSFSHAELDKFGSASLVTRITNDVNQVQTAVAMLIRLVVRAPFLVIGAAIMSMTIDLKLSIVFLVMIPLIVLVLYFVMSRSIPFYRVIQKKLDKLSLITGESLRGSRVIRAFSMQKHEEDKFAEANDDLLATSVSVGKLSALLNPATNVIINLSIAAIIWFGGYRVNDGILTQGQIIQFVNYMNQIFIALVVVANLVVLFTKASACATRINEVFDTVPSVADGEENATADKTSTMLEFRNVSFSYNNTEDYDLRNLSFTLKRGETLGVIGGTGSGKSTLINLIPRFYDCSKGEVFVDGINVKNYTLENLRQKIGVVPQKAVLFSGTIAENLKWGNADASEEIMEKALKVSQSWEFVLKMPDGLDTVLEQGGKNLSGGQKQRLTIARALTSQPDILILDDSASALDFATDAKLRKAIATELSDMTVIIVSQRANSLKNADKIIVLDDGVPVGMGTHSELLETCDLYKEICLSQFKEEELKATKKEGGQLNEKQ